MADWGGGGGGSLSLEPKYLRYQIGYFPCSSGENKKPVKNTLRFQIDGLSLTLLSNKIGLDKPEYLSGSVSHRWAVFVASMNMKWH